MEIVKSSLFSSCILFLTLVKIGECNPRCYICDTLVNASCIQPRDHKMQMQECSPANVREMKRAFEDLGKIKLAGFFEVHLEADYLSVPLQCMKTVVTDNDKEVIIRGCQLAPTENSDVCKRIYEEKEDEVTHCSFCDENGCNSAPFLTKSAALIVLLIAVLKIF